MKMLQRKLIRDLKTSKGLFAAVTIIILLAVAFFGSMFMAAQNLSDSYDYSYEKLRFADFTISVAQDASDATEQLQKIDGVAAVTSRSNFDLTLNLPENAKSKKVLARVISLPADQSARENMVNDVYVDKGDYFPESGGRYLLVEKNFADHHDLEPGQTVSLTINSDEVPFTIAGIAISPEYVFPAKSRQEILVSANVWGVVFVSDETATGLLGQPTNEFCFLTRDGYDKDEVLSRAEDILSSYQIMEIMPKEDQPSYDGLQMDLEQFNTLAELFPLLFIIVGAMATYILLTRIVYNQRTQVGLMRAVGYSRWQVMLHYLGFSLVIGLIGALLGSIAGYLLSEAITNWYASMINLPFTKMSLQWSGLVIGFFLGLLPCVLSGLMPAWGASKIPPAEAMRTPAPAAGRKLLLERIFPFIRRMSSVGKIPLRNIFRNRKRSLYTVIGVTFGISLILISAAMMDSINDWVNFTFNKVQRYDAQIEFAQPQPDSIVSEVAAWEDVEEVEPVLKTPVLMQFKDKIYTTLILAYPSEGNLRGLYSPSGKEIRPDSEGILLSEGLKDTLHIGTGDFIDLYFSKGQTSQKVIGFVKEPVGSFGYMPLETIQQVADEQNSVTGLLMKVPSTDEKAFREKAYALAAVSSVELTSDNKADMDKMMQAGMVMLGIMLLFGAVLAAAIVFTTITVNVLERRREIATMRTLGETNRRIGVMITIENLLLGLFGLIPGIILGYMIAVYFFSMFQGDMFSMDLVIYTRTYLLTVGIVIVIVLLSQVPSIRRLGRINLATATKEYAS